MIRVRPYTIGDRESWDRYVMSHGQGTLFHLAAWKEVIEKTFGHHSYYLIAEDRASLLSGVHRSICGILPLFRIRSQLFGHFMVSVPFAELGGVLSTDAGAARALLRRAEQLAAFFHCDYLELRNRTSTDGYRTKDLYFNFRREIFPDIDANFKAVPRKARRMIRQGEKGGLMAESGHHLLPEFYDIMAASYHHLGTPIFSRRLFENLLTCFGDKIQILLIRCPDGKGVAGVQSFFFKDQVVPYYAGSRVEYRNLAPNDFMYWQLMRYGCKNGYRVFDFGRSKIDSGSFHFKRHWGFVPTPLAYQYHLVKATEMPNLSPANPRYAKKIEMWRKLPLGVTKLLGPLIARNLV